MTRVCLLGSEEVSLHADLLGYETAREALSSYDVAEPFANSVCVDTISLGAAVSLLNDLNWYLVRLVDRAIVLEPSISDEEWLSRDLATAVRNEQIAPQETGDLLAIYGIVSDPASDRDDAGGDDLGESASGSDADGETQERDPDRGTPPRLTEPMFAQRVGDEIPAYDLHDVDDTLVVRVTGDEFGGT